MFLNINLDIRNTSHPIRHNALFYNCFLTYVSTLPLQANRVTDKLTYLSDRIYCCRSGSAADTQAIADVVHHFLQLYTTSHEMKRPTVHTAASFAQVRLPLLVH
jgi:hypothetical protein